MIFLQAGRSRRTDFAVGERAERDAASRRTVSAHEIYHVGYLSWWVRLITAVVLAVSRGWLLCGDRAFFCVLAGAYCYAPMLRRHARRRLQPVD